MKDEWNKKWQRPPHLSCIKNIHDFLDVAGALIVLTDDLNLPQLVEVEVSLLLQPLLVQVQLVNLSADNTVKYIETTQSVTVKQ